MERNAHGADAGTKSAESPAHGIGRAYGVDDDLDSEITLGVLNQALAVAREISQQCERQYFAALRNHSPAMAVAALEHANVAQIHTDQISARIVDLGGSPSSLADATVTRRSAEQRDGNSLVAVIGDHVAAQRASIESYRRIAAELASIDSSTNALIENIISTEQACTEVLARVLDGKAA